MVRRSIRCVKKKYKAKQMQQKMQALEVMPMFIANAKCFYEIVDFLGIDPQGWCYQRGCGIDDKASFEHCLKVLEPLFPPAYKTLWTEGYKQQLINSIRIEGRYEGITKDNFFHRIIE